MARAYGVGYGHPVHHLRDGVGAVVEVGPDDSADLGAADGLGEGIIRGVGAGKGAAVATHKLRVGLGRGPLRFEVTELSDDLGGVLAGGGDGEGDVGHRAPFLSAAVALPLGGHVGGEVGVLEGHLGVGDSVVRHLDEGHVDAGVLPAADLLSHPVGGVHGLGYGRGHLVLEALFVDLALLVGPEAGAGGVDLVGVVKRTLLLGVAEGVEHLAVDLPRLWVAEALLYDGAQAGAVEQVLALLLGHEEAGLPGLGADEFVLDHVVPELSALLVDVAGAAGVEGVEAAVEVALVDLHAVDLADVAAAPREDGAVAGEHIHEDEAEHRQADEDHEDPAAGSDFAD